MFSRGLVAAREGYIDGLVTPSETRERLAWALTSLGGSTGRLNHVD